MNYRKIYDQLVVKAKDRRKRDKKTMYLEKHHIQPRSLGGNDNRSNLVYLTAREHYLSHWLLFKFTTKTDDKIKMGFAFAQMAMTSESHNGRGITSRKYERAMKANSLAASMRLGKRNSNFGNYWTEEMKQALSEKKKGKMVGDANPSRRPEVRKLLADGKFGENNPNAKRWRVTDPTGQVFEFIGGLKRWLKEHGTTYMKVQCLANGWKVESI